MIKNTIGFSLLILFALLLSGCEYFHKITIGPAAQEYGEAWASHDVDKIVSMHTEDSVFSMHFIGHQPATGRDEIRIAVERIFETAPDYKAEAQEVQFGADFISFRYVATVTPTKPYQYGSTTFFPTGKTYQMELIDIITFEDGLVKSKHTYLDAESVYRNSVEVQRAPL